MKDLAISLLTQYVVPILVAALWFALATLIATVLGHKTQIEGWCQKNPRTAILVQVCRRTGVDVWGMLGALRQYSESKASLRRALGKVTSGAMVFSLLVATGGCAGTFEEAHVKSAYASKSTSATTAAKATVDQCHVYSERQYWFGGLAELSAATGAAAAGIAIPVKNDGLETALVVTAAVAGVVAAGSGYYSRQAGSSYLSEGCSQ